MSIQDAIRFTLPFEKGYWNDPVGGPTMNGVTQATYDSFRRGEGVRLQSVRLIEPEELQAIMENLYWYPGHCEDLPRKLGVCHFDCFFNADPKDSIKILQRTLGVAADGDYGEVTQKAAQAASDDLCEAYIGFREVFYRELASKKQAWANDLAGWLNRLDELKQYLTTL
ncbi:MAG: hypothetical protein KGL39_11230 [Patescibacteria group bacterium]|nr:hypothetical protein [Patescibacteria group bacterium]